MTSRTRWAVVLALTVFVTTVTAQYARQDGAPRASNEWWSHVEALAADDMEGRDTGTAAHKRAAEYVASQFHKAGLEPAGTNGYLQPIKFSTRRIVESQSSLALVRDGALEPLTLGLDANFNMRIEPAPAVDAPLVFVGYGLAVPEFGIHDLDGLNLKGAVVVHLAWVPPSGSIALQSHYGSNAERWKAFKAAGAIGTVAIANPGTMEIPWERATLARLQPFVSLADPSLDEFAGQRLAVAMNPAKAEKLFAGSGHSFQEMVALANAGKPVPRFPLAARIKATVRVEHSEIESDNVVGLLRGSDPQRRQEYVVLSAHLDHLGIGARTSGDRIYNGAMDNAAGVAAIIEIANQLRATGPPGRTLARSVLFVAVTGEEKGTLGSQYFASRPGVPASSLVANVNTDMFLPLFPLKTLMVLGLDESDLGGDIRAVTHNLGLAVQADPEPERNRFARSDQYSFVRAGIPALAMKVGYDANTPEEAIARKWTSERYHAPLDDLSQPVDDSSAARYIDVVRELAVRIAGRPDRPGWNDSSFFRRFRQP